MTFRTPVFLLVVALGCSSGPPPRSAADARDCDDAAVLAAIEVYPTGVQPQRPFQTLDGVEARWDVSTAGRVRTLKTKACELGADGVIGWSEVGVGGGFVSGTLQGNMLMMSGGGGHVVASGIAIVYTDRAQGAALPRLARASDGGPPIVVER